MDSPVNNRSLDHLENTQSSIRPLGSVESRWANMKSALVGLPFSRGLVASDFLPAL